jgi:uncharacterized protein YbjT (DUF2867 family)
MYIILGATGHIGSVLTRLLVEQGQKVTGITSSKKHVATIESMGATAAVANVQDTTQLTEIFKKGKRLYLLNPPAPIDTDTPAEEQKNINSIIEAVKQASFEKIVAESTYGAQPGDQLGDLDVLYRMEHAVTAVHANTTIIRGAYYMSNWDMSLPTAMEKGKIYSFYPRDFSLPMVAPADIAGLVARLLQAPAESNSLHYIEGPHEYTPGDVAEAFARALQKPIEVVVIERSQWQDELEKLGFSKKAAASMVNMTALTLEGPERPEFPQRGTTTLDQYIRNLVLHQRRSMKEQKATA